MLTIHKSVAKKAVEILFVQILKPNLTALNRSISLIQFETDKIKGEQTGLILKVDCLIARIERKAPWPCSPQ